MENYTVEMDEPNESTICQCGSCDWRGPFSKLIEIGDCSLTSGDGSPAGRCPDSDCESLAYLVDDPLTRAQSSISGLKIENARMYAMLVRLRDMLDDEEDSVKEEHADELEALALLLDEITPEPSKDREIVIIIQGGNVQSVDGVPSGVIVTVKDYDNGEENTDPDVESDGAGRFVRQTYQADAS